ncbi:hypothetical protein DFH06DRAFT_541351 [Mycena polygramma]|nr:hypothetical protein DFH06DRAFT_541351 [Mycena polygramma]
MTHDGTVITLPCLRSLEVQEMSPLCVLNVPSLERIEIWGFGFPHMSVLIQELRGLLARCSCPLQSLTFHCHIPEKTTPVEFKRFLRVAPPSVVALELTINYRGMLELIVVLQASKVLPRLETLCIVYRVEDAPAPRFYSPGTLPRGEVTESFEPLLPTLRTRATLKAFHLRLNRLSVLPSALRDSLLAFRSETMCVVLPEDDDPRLLTT